MQLLRLVSLFFCIGNSLGNSCRIDEVYMKHINAIDLHVYSIYLHEFLYIYMHVYYICIQGVSKNVGLVFETFIFSFYESVG